MARSKGVRYLSVGMLTGTRVPGTEFTTQTRVVKYPK